ncbi:1-aminocyclopropane-1-carboxylate oxidase homolog 1-like [Prunus yedoensis var. nudiflora]|uniref:1-aminocyclopropane-1-carboxylate oxidase homolog 1-like n=1 Tax=Prunus yedoensis var. nudiflora TaxID=2094558 RepID=A0A314ZK19_PRUYE|nr:1-aminocyclopropane-1-carboxylate oxidase homolog 1-like [Prunus yedoensis var. nudiflora]
MAPALVDYTAVEKELYEFDDLKIGVKGLVDAGVTHIPRFFIHPPTGVSWKQLISSAEQWR